LLTPAVIVCCHDFNHLAKFELEKFGGWGAGG
jgi:hypothetical protein